MILESVATKKCHSELNVILSGVSRKAAHAVEEPQTVSTQMKVEGILTMSSTVDGVKI